VYKRTELHSMQLKLRSALGESEICSNLFRRGVRPIEFECEYLPRLSGESKGASLKTTTRAVREVAKLILSRRS